LVVVVVLGFEVGVEVEVEGVEVVVEERGEEVVVEGRGEEVVVVVGRGEEDFLVAKEIKENEEKESKCYYGILNFLFNCTSFSYSCTFATANQQRS